MPMLDPNEVKAAIDLLVRLHPQVRFTHKAGKRVILFPPGTSVEACQALTVLSLADQMVHQKYLDSALLEGVSRVRNLYHSCN